jgi:hypothetical protein
MNIIMLGKKELASVLVILVCVTIYFIYEFYVNQKQKDNTHVLENFQNNNMNAKNLDDERKINIGIFKSYFDFVTKEKEFFRNDIDIANYFIKKKFNLEQVLSKPKIVNNIKTYLPNQKMNSLINLRKAYLTSMINELEAIIGQIDILETRHDFYEHFKTLLFEMKYIYEDKLTYFTPDKSNYFDLEKLAESYVKSSNNDYNDIITNINTSLITSNKKFKDSSENLEKTSLKLIEVIDNSNNIDKDVKNKLSTLIQTRLEITLKIVVRSLSFNFIDTVVLLGLSGKVSNEIAKDKAEAAKESNIIVGELIELFNLEFNNVNDVLDFFQKGNKGSIVMVDNEFKYFNTVDSNTNTLINFCKKMKKMDRPNNNNMIFKRMAREFVKKKNNQIGKLEQNINQIMGEMSVSEAYNHNLYTLRTSEESQKQIDAIKQAQENIDSMGKFKINLK